MTAENFCYWLQGFFEISGERELSKEQVWEIQNHLKLVLKKVTPISYNLKTHPTITTTVPLNNDPYVEMGDRIPEHLMHMTHVASC